MNPRIRECAIEAGLDSNYIEGFDSIYSKQLERFAELIVRECLTIVERKEYSYHEADPLWETAQLIKEHFGVER